MTSLAENAFALGDTPSDPAERFPFIEGVAHTGDWSKALELTRDSAAVTNLIHPQPCALWKRIDREVPASVGKAQSLAALKYLPCVTP